jgi:hypothetical protein
MSHILAEPGRNLRSLARGKGTVVVEGKVGTMSEFDAWKFAGLAFGCWLGMIFVM